MSAQPEDRSFWNKVIGKDSQPKTTPGPFYKQIGQSFYIYAPPAKGNVLTRAWSKAVWAYRTNRLASKNKGRPVDPYGPMSWDPMGMVYFPLMLTC